jgi:hypothetical protein
VARSAEVNWDMLRGGDTRIPSEAPRSPTPAPIPQPTALPTPTLQLKYAHEPRMGPNHPMLS